MKRWELLGASALIAVCVVRLLRVDGLAAALVFLIVLQISYVGVCIIGVLMDEIRRRRR